MPNTVNRTPQQKKNWKLVGELQKFAIENPHDHEAIYKRFNEVMVELTRGDIETKKRELDILKRDLEALHRLLKAYEQDAH